MEVDPADKSEEESPEQKALLAIRSLKAKFPLSDKFLQELFKVLRLGIDLSTISSPEKVRSVLSLEYPSTVSIVQCCTGCGIKVDDTCNNVE